MSIDLEGGGLESNELLKLDNQITDLILRVNIAERKKALFIGDWNVALTNTKYDKKIKKLKKELTKLIKKYNKLKQEL